ncbi:MAG: hypothetical protein R6V12_07480, partial [Candidatus Hydrogenedentota bacterium]
IPRGHGSFLAAFLCGWGMSPLGGFGAANFRGLPCAGGGFVGFVPVFVKKGKCCGQVVDGRPNLWPDSWHK